LSQLKGGATATPYQGPLSVGLDPLQLMAANIMSTYASGQPYQTPNFYSMQNTPWGGALPGGGGGGGGTNNPALWRGSTGGGEVARGGGGANIPGEPPGGWNPFTPTDPSNPYVPWNAYGGGGGSSWLGGNWMEPGRRGGRTSGG
jgi:hypothetical protein